VALSYVELITNKFSQVKENYYDLFAVAFCRLKIQYLYITVNRMVRLKLI